jgi:hypothetical protein
MLILSCKNNSLKKETSQSSNKKAKSSTQNWAEGITSRLCGGEPCFLKKKIAGKWARLGHSTK